MLGVQAANFAVVCAYDYEFRIAFKAHGLDISYSSLPAAVPEYSKQAERGVLRRTHFLAA